MGGRPSALGEGGTYVFACLSAVSRRKGVSILWIDGYEGVYEREHEGI